MMAWLIVRALSPLNSLAPNFLGPSLAGIIVDERWKGLRMLRGLSRLRRLRWLIGCGG